MQYKHQHTSDGNHMRLPSELKSSQMIDSNPVTVGTNVMMIVK